MHIAVLAEPDSFHTRKWTTALLDAGVKVTVFSFSRFQLPHVTCVPIEPPFARQGGPSYWSYLYGGKRLRQALLAHRVDLVNPIDVTPFGVWARRAEIHPIMAVAMGADILEYPPRDLAMQVPMERLWGRGVHGPARGIELMQYPLKKWLFRREVARALQSADFITGDNMVLVRAMQEWFGVEVAKTALNRWGVEPELFEMSEAEEAYMREKYQLFPGQRLLLSPRGIKPVYQGDIILDAFSHLASDPLLQDTRMIMLSAGYAIPSNLLQAAEDLEKRFPRFSLIRKAIPREEMCWLWNFTDVFVSAPIYDGYSNSLSEGRYVGAIPVVNDTPATREVMVDGLHGRILSDFQAQALATEIREIFSALPAWKERVAAPNEEWVIREATLSVNIREFIRQAEILVERMPLASGKFS